ncbi:hypothetical protein GCM10018793_44770 [Streptomyces sulfonofaciens]|uniref:N-acetyltransferase domain-containing protein n=1 Tax=Streptomyces sulfonofaciens TaxID=68272 RepID=A0A919GF20_9ACTN|nr:GNAT family N-acetyltransferase [Streptomyces sulfonofaciens]GHH83224.1 hypothetical protein GCM10018793_44770 [Streptomyces sulfonofaciens]
MSDPCIELRHATDLDSVRKTITSVYAEVWAERLADPHHSVERYEERLARYAAQPGWEAVIGHDSGEPVGCAYVSTLDPGHPWWQHMSTPLPEGCGESPTVALRDIMVRVPWRGRGVARLIHDGILANRREDQVTLLVNAQNGNGKVKALYEEWGHRTIGEQQPFADGPVLTAMLRATRTPAAGAANAATAADTDATAEQAAAAK